MSFIETNELTPREYTLMENEKEENRLNREHAVTIKRLDIQVSMLEAKWASWFALPKYIIKLPVLILFGIAYIASVIMKVTLPKEFWNFINK